MPRSLTIQLLSAAFLLSVIGAWAWFNTDIGCSGSRPSTLDSGPRLWLTARTNIPGYTFIPEPVSESAMKTLGTTNILSGTFCRIAEDRSQKSDVSNQSPPLTSDAQHSTLDIGHSTSTLISDLRPLTSDTALDPRRSGLDAASRITVFLASWPVGNNTSLDALRHTPNRCWIGTGWKERGLDQPNEVRIMFNVSANANPETGINTTESRGRTSNLAFEMVSAIRSPVAEAMELSFTCGAFESPDSKSLELAAWTALVAGYPVVNTGRTGSTQTNGAQSNLQGYRVSVSHFMSAIRNRIPIKAEMQYVRISTPRIHDTESALDRLSNFTKHWITIVQLGI